MYILFDIVHIIWYNPFKIKLQIMLSNLSTFKRLFDGSLQPSFYYEDY